MTVVDRSLIDELIAFHGHFCPGLASGIRVCEAALGLLGERASDEELVAVIEATNCAADAIQFMLGCTLGKGNLITMDRGRNVYTIARRSDGRAVRVRTKPSPLGDLTPEEQAIVGRGRAETATAEDRRTFDLFWQTRAWALLELPLDAVIEAEQVKDYAIPERAAIEPSLRCSGCGAMVMASRLARREDQQLCQACLAEQHGRVGLTVIGWVENALDPESAASRERSPRSRIRILPSYRKGLSGLEPGQRVQGLFVFDRSPEDPPLQQHPRGDRSQAQRGVFSLRSPHRPSPIGLTTVTVLEVTDDALVVEGLDAWNGTPVLDIKPYAGTFDA